MSRNGKNNKGGRPKGRTPAVLAREATLKAFRDRVAKNADRILSAQLAIGLGQQFLYKIHTNAKGMKEKAELITEEDTIRAYLDGELAQNDNNDWYFITTKEPDNRSIDSMLDRTFGRATQPISGDEEKGPLTVTIIKYAKKKE